MKKVMLFFAVAVIALGANAQGEKKETSTTKPMAKKEASKPADKKEAAKPAPAKKDAKKDAPATK